MVCHGTAENPILVKEQRCANGEYVEWEYRFIAGELGYYQRCMQELLDDNGRQADRVVVRTANGTHHSFCFDITSQYKAQKSQLEEILRSAGICPKCGDEGRGLHQCS
jgi:hypothetical protein